MVLLLNNCSIDSENPPGIPPSCRFGTLWHSVLYGRTLQVLPSAAVVLGLCLTTPLGLFSDLFLFGKHPNFAQIWGACLVITGVVVAFLEPGKSGWKRADQKKLDQCQIIATPDIQKFIMSQGKKYY